MKDKAWNYIFQISKKYKVYFFVLIFLATLASLFGIFVDFKIKEIIDLISSSESTKNLKILLLLFVFYKFAYSAILFCRRLANIYYKPKVLYDVIKGLYSKLTSNSLYWFDTRFSGDIISKISDFQNNYLMLITDVFSVTKLVVSFVFSIFFLFKVHYLPVVVLLLFSIIYFPILWFLTKKQMNLHEIYTKYRQKTLGLFNDSFSNVFAVKIIGTMDKEFGSNLDSTVKDWMKYEKKIREFDAYVIDVFDTFMSTVLMITQVFLLLYLYQFGQITLGSFVFAIMINSSVHDKLKDFVFMISFEVIPKIVIIRTFLELLDDGYEIKDKKNAKVLSKVKGDIIFENVYFNYDGGADVIHNLNLEIKAGERIGIVGPSGAGKTTIVKCLLRYFDLKSGKIFIDGNDIRDVTQDSLYKNIAIIPQDPMIFHRTILENLQLASECGTFDEVVEICKKVEIHDDILRMENGYNTIVGENGVKLSGGQKQRVAIVRAMLKNAPVVIFDEATSALDSLTEEIIQESLNGVFLESGATMILIAHRLSTLINMDRIIVLNEGRIVGNGNHEDLLKNNDLYRRMFERQAEFECKNHIYKK